MQKKTIFILIFAGFSLAALTLATLPYTVIRIRNDIDVVAERLQLATDRQTQRHYLRELRRHMQNKFVQATLVFYDNNFTRIDPDRLELYGNNVIIDTVLYGRDVRKTIRWKPFAPEDAFILLRE